MADYYENANRKPQRFYVYVKGDQTALGANNYTLTGYATPFIQQIRSDRVKVSLKSINLVVSTTTTVATNIDLTGMFVLRGKNPTNIGADVSEKAILNTFATEGRSGQVNAFSYNSSASDEIAVSLNKLTDLDDGRLQLQLVDLTAFGDPNVIANTPVFMQGILEIVEESDM